MSIELEVSTIDDDGTVVRLPGVFDSVKGSPLYLIRTSPPCLVNRETGEIVDLPEPARRRCSRCGVHHA